MSYVNVKCTRGGNGWCFAIELYQKAWKLYSSSKKSFFAAPGYENEREESKWQTWSHHEERPIILPNNLTNSDQKNWSNTLVVKLTTACILIIHKLSKRWGFFFYSFKVTLNIGQTISFTSLILLFWGSCELISVSLSCYGNIVQEFCIN